MSRARSLANLANSGVFSADASTSRVGINSSAPERTLDVVGDGRVSGTLSIGGTINYEDVTSIDSIGVVTARQGVHIVSAGASIYSPANNELALYTNSSEALRIDSDGDIGIGTDNPATKLDVRGGNWANGDIVVGESGNAGRIKFRRGADGSDTGSIGFSAADDNSVLSMNVASGDGTLTFQTNSVERLRITSAGLVGIGTLSPTHPLEVRGSNTQINFASSVTGGGYLMSTGAGEWSISGGVRYNGAGWYARHTSSSLIRDDGDAL